MTKEKPELKTLKDLPKIFITPNEMEVLLDTYSGGEPSKYAKSISGNYVEQKILHQVVIEWYKELNWTNIVELPDGDFIYEGEEVRKFIKHFFNLTEDDLKEVIK